MADITITINTDGAAFEDYDHELSSILKKLSEAALHYDVDGLDDLVLHDTNGNTVGKLTVTQSKES